MQILIFFKLQHRAHRPNETTVDRTLKTQGATHNDGENDGRSGHSKIKQDERRMRERSDQSRKKKNENKRDLRCDPTSG